MTALYQAKDYFRLLPQGKPNSKGYRSEFRKDFGRLLHSASFRRLQGKTQLFPGFDSDFFRNRLTHSLEVAQVAKCIALRMNDEHIFFKPANHKIDTDLVEFAALAHDLGHPPFGHNGEEALNDMMAKEGGFEGNAQTLHILVNLARKVEAKPPKETDFESLGLNLTMRSLAAVLKYDASIPMHINAAGAGKHSKCEVMKGYYLDEKEIVDLIKEAVVYPNELKKVVDKGAPFRTLECSIMDLADDIAYSTYDLEDAFKAGFLNPLDLIGVDNELQQKVLASVNKALGKANFPATDSREFARTLNGLFHVIFPIKRKFIKLEPDRIAAALQSDARIAAMNNISRTQMTSQLIQRFVEAVKVTVNKQVPALSIAYLPRETLLEVEILKHLTFQLITMSHRLRIVKSRGKEIVTEIFKSLEDEPDLMPDDFVRKYQQLDKAGKHGKAKRVICDFIAGMTDTYAIEYYARLKSEEHRTIFQPL